ncbi:hypothetical protein AcW1_009966 [Taiwanofungus camphoratus]|nr:hypothetical protein AcV5_003200 [Antrodia cinnamomea]KAI0929471.1 hypothetical protein AcV7_005315 [Antrodia cinnamomea]KAI0946526.1 hypothetical protein AcW1_009966 [Antrodia cinnamomea]
MYEPFYAGIERMFTQCLTSLRLQNYVATLAKDVDPTSRSQKVWISPTWGPNGSDYHMRFICDDPPITVYSAEFTLTDMSDTRPYDGAEQAMTQSAPTDTSPASISTAMLKFGPLNTTMVSTSTSTITRPSTAATGTPPPISDQNEDPYIKNKKTGASSGSLWKRTAVDLERIKFRVVFILWPALVGITMAL